MQFVIFYGFLNKYLIHNALASYDILDLVQFACLYSVFNTLFFCLSLLDDDQVLVTVVHFFVI